ncbi:MAG: 4Fe-4S binding protein [Candidatus Abyssubacteria bacterium]|nr:4Fe-4S binding protein [Candidatus Abyssubacteria bacterium]
MCTYCMQYGEGTAWYLNPKNFTDHARNLPHVMDSGMIEIFGGNAKMDLEIGTAAGFDLLIPDLGDKENIESLDSLVETRHGGQIVTVEEVKKIIDISEGDNLLYVPCYCRKYFGAVDRLTCLWLYPISEMAPKNRPWEKQKVVSKAEAKKQQEAFHEEGLVAGIYWTPLPIPMVVCNCELPYCMAMRARAHYGLKNITRKGHNLASINARKCDGCGGFPMCAYRCQFGALTYSVTDKVVSVDYSRCFGCGVCRPSCPRKAISLIPRESVPAVAESY